MTTMGRAARVQAVCATIGFATRDDGAGVAYARLRDGRNGEQVLRAPFRCRPLPALRGRNVAYAALAAIVRRVLESDVRRVRFEVADADLVADLAEHRAVPAPLTIPYVTLRCALNRFAEATVVVAEGAAARDLTARARAEALLEVAA
jgi:hypothetical protein